MKRHQSRRDALQILYQLDVNRQVVPHAAMYQFEKHFAESGKALEAFAQELVSGVNEHRAEIDLLIETKTAGWKLARMPAVDRNILRLGVFELKWRDDVPKTVTLDEMVELAKEFGSEESPGFVNGVLDALASGVQNPKKAP